MHLNALRALIKLHYYNLTYVMKASFEPLWYNKQMIVKLSK